MPKTVLLLLTGILLFVWPIPETITIRETALVLSLAITLFLIRKNGVSSADTLRRMKVSLGLYALFIAWMLVVAFLISPDSSWTLKEMRSQWLPASLTMALGMGMALLVTGKTIDISSILSVLFFVLLAHVVIICGNGAHTVLRDLGANEFQGLTFTTRTVRGLTRSPIDASVITVFLLGLASTEAVFRAFYGTRLLKAGSAALASAICVSLAGSVLCGMRNIVELVLMVVCSVTLLFAHKELSRRKGFLIPVLLLGAVFVFVFFKSDPRWATLRKSVNLAMSTEHKWDIRAEDLKNGGYAIEPVEGEMVSISNYLRFEKYELALRTVAAKPLGVGFGRNALGKSVESRYGNAKNLNADSSMLDIFVGTGVAGGILWVSFLASMLIAAIKAFKGSGSYFAFWLVIVVTAFGARMSIDSMGKDHLLQEFMYTAGLLLVLVRAKEPLSTASPPC